MQAYRIGASSREKRKLKELQEHFAPLIAPYEERIAALEAKVSDLEVFSLPASPTPGVTVDKRGSGRPPNKQ